MKKTLKKSVSILLTFIMVFSVFSVVPFTVSAAGSVLTLSDSNASGTGWTWNASTKTLTMSGATFDDCVWLKVDSATIVLTDGTNNVMHGGMYNTTSTGRKCWSCICVGTIMPTASGQFFETEGTLTIKGSGKLTMSPTTTTHYFDTFAINCYKLIFGTGSDNPVLDYTAQKSYFHSYALQMNSGFTLNSGDIKLSCGEFARSGQDWFAVGVLVRNGGANAIVINDGSLEIDVSEGALTFNSNNDIISTCKGLNTLNSGSITINGGNIDINVAGNANTQRCIDASGKVTINAGTLKLKNTKNNQAAYAGGNLAIGEFTTYTDCSQSGKYIYLTSTDTQGTIVTKKPCTVTWKNGDEVLKTEALAEGSTPSYDGTTPEKAEDENYTYTFSGWNNGETTYAPDQLPAVSGNVTYTAQYTATAKTFKVYAKKLTGETYTIENLTGETTVAQLKEIIADQIDIPVTAQQRLIFSGKQLEDAKTLAEYNIGKESTIHLVIRGYTVTWLNYDNSEL
ncbi:MAG: carbohydrate-binding domain-containing protein, partial [Ruminococcus sp.]|nr:carbohydrate-binding domain-containing protein [Ruminococcus sp.]